LIADVHAALKALGTEEVVIPAEEKKPAVPVRKSVTPDYIICLEDGKKFKSLKRHLRTHYNLSPEEYREKWGLPADYPMVAPSYSATRSQLAKDNGLGRKAG
jgi:predicted transcriptional regulator